jgi:CRP/FNR family transcriptional regulator
MADAKRLKEMPLFKDLSDEEIEKVSSIMKEVFYSKGTVIYEEGAAEQGLQVIDFGKVRVSKRTKEGDRQILAVLKKNSFFGELSLLDGRSHSASVEALEDTKVLVMKRPDMERLLQENPQTAYKIVRKITIAICEKLRDMNEKFMNMVNYVWE